MRRRILLLVVGMTVLVVLAFAIPLTVLIRDNAAQNARTATSDEARRVSLYLRSYPTPSRLQISRTVARLTASEGRPISVRLPGGRTIGSLPPGVRPVSAAVPGYGSAGDHYYPPGGRDGGYGGPMPGAPGSALTPTAGGAVAVSAVASPAGFSVVQVFQSDATLYDGATGELAILGGVAVALIVVGAAAGEVLTRRIVRPLVETADTAQRLSVGDTIARAPTTGPPEVAAVGQALNRLADRIDQLIEEERETVADLSHRLRTPLTALRLEAEALHDPADAERIGLQVGALERMLTAVIRAARRPQREGRMPSCDASAVVAERVAFWSALTEEQGRRATVSLPAVPLPVRAAAEDLAAAVDALLENIVAHTAEGTAFAVSLTAEDAGAVLVIADAGPGLPADEPVRGRSDRGSSGLGLDIARRCAEASGGGMTLDRGPDGGARVTLRFGPA